jgi:hypothetical protein
MTILDSVMYAGFSAGMKLGVALKNAYDWTPLFLGALLLHGMNVLYILFRIKEPNKEDKKKEKNTTEESNSSGTLTLNFIFESPKMIGPFTLYLRYLFQTCSKHIQEPFQKARAWNKNMASHHHLDSVYHCVFHSRPRSHLVSLHEDTI